MKSSIEIRNMFLEYFQEQGHEIVPSSPIIAKDDPTLLFTNAGMNQFKDNFLGIKAPKAPRLADTQKCLRASGKHNDLEEVGHDTYHHTMFEMLGNWSFGDYYKQEAIEWAWELLTKRYGIDPDLLYITVFGGDKADQLGEDTEAVAEWKKWIPDSKILRFDKKDNFWEMGETGPCGPCSEIHIDLRSPEDKARKPGADLVNMDHPEVIEIWNLVFMEFNRKADRSLEPLPAKSVDTGMGLERLVMALQGKKSNYDTDMFAPYIAHLEQHHGCKYGRSKEESIAMRVVMDHIRAVSFSIADGQIPSNTGAGYVVRRILRRASRYGYQFLGRTEPFLHELVDVLAHIYKDVFPEVVAQQAFIKKQVEEEEKSFLRTLSRGIKLFDEYILENGGGNKLVDGRFVFKLYDTFGFPPDLTSVMATEQGWTVDTEGYEAAMAEQKGMSSADAEKHTGDWVEVTELDGMPQFTGYDREEDTVRIIRYRTITTAHGPEYQLVLHPTPFYAESGGQVGDMGSISKSTETIRVLDTQKENDLIVHFTDRLPVAPSGEWQAEVDHERRRLIRANHSATHLLHAALRQVLGTHVEQRGSLVNDMGFRFDFSHHQRLSKKEIAQVERIVNAKIGSSVPLHEHQDVPLEKAKSMGAMALFGEKYGEEVRVIVFDPEFSVELCGGIHVPNTAEIRLLKITSESSITAGVRRIEAVTSDGALEWMQDKVGLLGELRKLMKNPQDPMRYLSQLLEQNKALEKELKKAQQAAVGDLRGSLAGKAVKVAGIQLISEVVEVPSATELKTLVFDLRNKLGDNAVVVLGASFDGKPLLNIGVSDDLAKGGKVNAGQMIRVLAAEIKGGGGGPAHFANAGGKDVTGLPNAIAKAAALLES